MGLNVLATIDSGTDGTSYATAAFTPPPSTRIFALFIRNSGTEPDDPSLTQTGQTWSKVFENYFDTNATGNQAKTYLYRCDVSASPSNAALNVDTGDTSDMMALVVFSIDDLDEGASPGDEFQQAAVHNSGTGTSGSATLGAAPSGGNVVVAIIGKAVRQTITAGDGYTKLTGFDEQTGGSGRAHTMTVIYDETPAVDGVADGSWSTSGDWGVSVIEFKIAAAGGGQAPRSLHQFRQRRAA